MTIRELANWFLDQSVWWLIAVVLINIVLNFITAPPPR